MQSAIIGNSHFSFLQVNFLGIADMKMPSEIRMTAIRSLKKPKSVQGFEPSTPRLNTVALSLFATTTAL